MKILSLVHARKVKETIAFFLVLSALTRAAYAKECSNDTVITNALLHSSIAFKEGKTIQGSQFFLEENYPHMPGGAIGSDLMEYDMAFVFRSGNQLRPKEMRLFSLGERRELGGEIRREYKGEKLPILRVQQRLSNACWVYDPNWNDIDVLNSGKEITNIDIKKNQHFVVSYLHIENIENKKTSKEVYFVSLILQDPENSTYHLAITCHFELQPTIYDFKREFDHNLIWSND